uniref:hypothetical protein n=1 Tax=Flavobacterium sp. TaxID=239 RepID=UPI00404A0E39
MKKTLQILIILTFGLNLSAQDVKINMEIEVESTEIKIIEPDLIYYAYSSFDNKQTDSLIVTIGTVGTSVTAIKIDLTDKPKVYITLWSDYAEFNGKETLDVELESYDLELNATEFKKGDRIMGRIKGKSKTISNSIGNYQIKFNGEFNHTIGKLMIKKKAEENYRIIDNE